MIYEQRLFTDDKGRKVKMKQRYQTRADGTETTMGILPEFFGHAFIGVQRRPGGPVEQFPVEFPIPANNIYQAFENFEQASLAAHRKTREQIEAASKRIVLAGPGHVQPVQPIRR